MMNTSVDLETCEFLVVHCSEKIAFRCPIYLTDLSSHESIDRFVARHGGVDETVSYLRRLLANETRRSMGLSKGASRTLLEEDTNKYSHFAHIDIIVLPPGDDKAIDKLEGSLQIEPDIRDDYTWDSLANMMKIRQTLHGLDTAKLAEFYRRKEGDVKELLDMLDYAAKYLENRGKSRQWSEVSDKEFAFQQMVRKRGTLNTAGEKQLFEAVAFVLIDDPEGGRLYQAIPDAHKNFDLIKTALAEAFTLSASTAGDGLDILGGDPVVSGDVPLALAIGKDEESRKKAAGIVKNLIDMTKLLDKEKKSADFLLNQLQKANALIQNAHTAGLRPESRKEGVSQQLDAIEQGVARIRKWLTQNA